MVDRKTTGTRPAESESPHVLLIDDDGDFLRDIGEQLADQVRSVRAVRTAREALEVLATAPVDVVVCDLVLAGDDGLALLERIRQTRPAIARVLITGFGARADERVAFPAAQAVVYKPCEASSLAALLNALPGAAARSARGSGETGTPLGPGLSFHTRVRCDGEVSLALEGALDEAADLRGIDRLRSARPAGPLVLDLGGVRAVNSAGAHQLVLFLEALGAEGAIAAERCTPAIVNQLNLLPELSGRLAVRSVVAPLECPRCGWQRDVVVPVARGAAPVIPVLSCRECAQPMALADLPDRFFVFLEAPPP